MPMDSQQFRVYGKEMVDYICDYNDTLASRRVISAVEPGYLAPLLPTHAPAQGEPWEKIVKDIDTKIMPGITHWQHPGFHAYFPSGAGFPSILGDMLSDAIGCIGFSWAASPACTELETIVLDWFGRAINLPSAFIFSHPGSTGGGVIQGSASECILVPMLAARKEAIRFLQAQRPGEKVEDAILLPKLVAYCSADAHSCVEKAAMIALVKLRILETDEKSSLRGSKLREAIEADLKEGLHPFFVSGTLGTTGSCAFDHIDELAEVTKALPACWMHVDAAYAGSGFLCPELQPLMKGIDLVDSFNTNCNKWLNVNFDCSCLWVRDRIKLTSAMVVDPLYLHHEHDKTTIDYRHWGVPLSRRFRALKLWFTLRNYGIEGLQEYIRNHCRMAKHFEKLVRADRRFEVCNDVKLGLVCFRLKGREGLNKETIDRLNQNLLATINSSGKIHMIPSMIKGKYIIRFCVDHEYANTQHMEFSWTVVKEQAALVLESLKRELGLPPTPTLDLPQHPRKLQRRFSFTRSVSREEYQKRQSRSSLYDGATPIVVPEDDGTEDQDDLELTDLAEVEDVFENNFKLDNENHADHTKSNGNQEDCTPILQLNKKVHKPHKNLRPEAVKNEACNGNGDCNTSDGRNHNENHDK